MFESERRDLSWVPRWSIIRCTRQQSVAEHSYFVAAYGSRVAELINWPKADGSIQSQLHRCDMRYKLVVYLLRHDEAEAIESDIPGPIKTLGKYDREGVLGLVKARFGDKPFCTVEMKSIRIVADLLDECMYLAGELNAGNRAVMSALDNSRRRLMEAIDKLPGDADARSKLAATLAGVVAREAAQTKNMEGFYDVR